MISPELCCNKRRLRINKRGRRGGKHTKQGYRNCFRFNLQVNQSNVTEIKINYTWSKALRNNITIRLINAQSIKGKDLLLKDVLCKDNIDA